MIAIVAKVSILLLCGTEDRAMPEGVVPFEGPDGSEWLGLALAKGGRSRGVPGQWRTAPGGVGRGNNVALAEAFAIESGWTPIRLCCCAWRPGS
jgi:hypothetical protein